MRAFKSLSTAMAKGFLRDRMALFFSILFPLMFLLLFGGLLANQGAPKSSIVQVGAVSVLDQASAETKQVLKESLDVTKSADAKATLREVRKGRADAMIEQRGNTIIVRYSQADQVKAAVVQGTFQAIVQSANIAASGKPPTFGLETQQVEDESLSTIQFVTPGLLGWAIAMGATFGAATNLVAWRKNGLLRRLRLAPISTTSVVLARVVISIGLALLQAAMFLGLGIALFGLKLAGAWPMIIPLLVAGTLAFLSIGLLAGSISKTEEGAIGLANFVVLPMAFLSGSFFPLDGAPDWLQAIGSVLPLRHLNDGMLDTMVRGEGPSSALAPIAILLGFAVVLAAISARLFRWDAD